MYDYKFRQKAPSFKETKHTQRRIPLLAAGLVLVTGLLYGIISLGPTSDSGLEVPETASDIIPLQLPPSRYTGPEESIRAIVLCFHFLAKILTD